MKIFRKLGMILILSLLFTNLIMAADYYISVGSGKGKVASKEKPAKDLGNIITLLQPGDTIHIAEGIYKGRSENGHYKIEVPVKIIGGYNEDFSKRDPWGAHKTILSGNNKDEDASDQPRIIIELHLKYQSKEGEKNEVLIDGVIIDNKERNQYINNGLMIKREFNPATQEKQSPGTPGIRITTSPYVNATIKNCMIMNCASMTGALVVSAGKKSDIKIDNNLIINNTGDGIKLLSGFKSSHIPSQVKNLPSYEVSNNSILFSWKISDIDEPVGSGIKTDSDCSIILKNNILAFNDKFGVDNIINIRGTSLLLKDNLFCGNHWTDYKEAKVQMSIEDVEDEADHLDFDSSGNILKNIKINVNKEWGDLYMVRTFKRRSEIEKDVKAETSRLNDIRSMLGLSLKGTDTKSSVKFWLHPMKIEDALKNGVQKIDGKYGCAKP